MDHSISSPHFISQLSNPSTAATEIVKHFFFLVKIHQPSVFFVYVTLLVDTILLVLFRRHRINVGYKQAINSGTFNEKFHHKWL